MVLEQTQNLNGFSYLLRGLKRLPEPGIRLFVVIPLIINLILYTLIAGYSISQFSSWMNYLLASVPGWLSFLQWIVWPLFFIMLIIIVYFSFIILANFIAAPFYGLLAENIQKQAGGVALPEASFMHTVITVVPKSLWRELQKIMWLLPRIMLLFILSFIPVINFVTPFLWILLGAWSNAVQYTDYPADNNNISFRQLLQFLKKRRIKALTFGGTISFLILIPLVNLFIMPAAVIGGTLMWLDNMPEHQPNNQRSS